ncbi:MAG: HU family DNA-binding protein [Dysgonamonadaceae bacterium]|jgi:nucleoid DNA-binding protein|nr:HU family DNA-binding protein [Dysgonamonadaceae bacterium]
MNNNAHIVQYLSEKTRWPLPTTETIFDTLTHLMVKELSAGNDLQLSGFGQLEVKNLSGRKTVIFKSSVESISTLKDPDYLENEIRVSLNEEERKLSTEFTTEIFFNLELLLIEKRTVSFGALGAFLYQIREGAGAKITFMPSSFLRSELNKNSLGQQQTERPSEKPIEPVREEVKSIQEEIKPIQENTEPVQENIEPAQENIEPIQEDLEKKDVEEVDDDQQELQISNEANSTGKRKEPKKKRKKWFGFKMFGYTLLILIILVGLVFVAYRYFPEYIPEFVKQYLPESLEQSVVDPLVALWSKYF